MLVSRKPFMVEFSGTPEAGKTTTINTVANIMRNANYRVIVLRESAESLPDEIAKGTFQANMWMHFITQAGLLKAVHADADIFQWFPVPELPPRERNRICSLPSPR